MKTIKHLFTALLLLCATTATAFEIDGIYYNITDATNKTVEVTSGTNKYIGSVVIPESVTYNSITYSITSISDYAFFNCSSLTNIEIPNSVTSLGSHVFYDCTSLSSVVIGNNVTSIGNAAFAYCYSLTSIEIPNSVTSIGNGAFYVCLKLKEVHISDIAAWCAIDFSSYDSNPLSWAENLYLNGELLTELSIPAEVEKVKNYAFYNCKSVTNIDIIDGVKSIGNNAFKNCKNLKTLYISNTIESIDDNAFAGCNNILDIKIGSKEAIAANENVFSNDAYNNACLYVPDGRKDFYAKTSPWSNFIIREMDYTGVEEVLEEMKGENGTNGRRPEGLKANLKTIYDLNGRAVENPSKGIYIIDGKKVLVK